MNFFIIDRDVRKAARELDDSRVFKIGIECAQCLSTELHKLENLPAKIREQIPNKKAHENHPCTLWTGENRAQFRWVMKYMQALCDEYKYRHDKDHVKVVEIEFYKRCAKYFPKGTLGPFQNSSAYKRDEDTIRAYRRTMVDKWIIDYNVTRWTRRHPPEWVFDYNWSDMIQTRLQASFRTEKQWKDKTHEWLAERYEKIKRKKVGSGWVSSTSLGFFNYVNKMFS